MTTRLRLHRVFLCVLCVGAVFMVLSLQHSWSAEKPSQAARRRFVETADEQQNDDDKATATAALPVKHKPKPPKVPEEESGEVPGRSWYMKHGNAYPEVQHDEAKLFPDQVDSASDRIVEQLMYMPSDYEGPDTPEKVILLYGGRGSWDIQTGPVAFHKCPINRCTLTDDRSRAADAHAILFKDNVILPAAPRPSNQIWILYILECPFHTQLVYHPTVINWTATYRIDSDLVAPYEKWVYYDDNIRQKPQLRDYASNKTKKVAWFVSNCVARNDRMAYARELAKHIEVDVYGACGSLSCSRYDNENRCFDYLDKDYKFYLAFENSNCRDYITEKFYVNALGRGIIPIVMGARPVDYELHAPEHSYIHVDDFSSPAEMAEYLDKLDKDDELYNAYFRWKGTGEFINTYFWCRLCSLMHSPPRKRHYKNINDWWRGPGVCTSQSWRNV